MGTSGLVRLLVVDDEEGIRRIIQRGAEALGWEVVCGGSGEDALRLAFAEEFDLIVLDITMPPPNGRKVLGILKQDPRTQAIPVFVLTANDVHTDRLALLQLGAHDVLEKPFDTTLLLRRIDQAVRKSWKGEI